MKSLTGKRTVLIVAAVLATLIVLAGCPAAGAGGGGGGGGGDGTTTTYTVTYDANDAASGTVPVDSNSYSSGDTVTVLGNTGSPALSKGSDTFVGWNLAQDGTGTNYSPGVEFTMGSADVTLYARFTTATTYTVEFDSNGGSSVADQTVVDGETAVEPVDPTRSGFQFNGWRDRSGLYDFADPVNSDITLTADWTEFFTVSFEADGGAPTPASQEVLEGGNATEPTAPTRSGYDFEGWSADGGTSIFNFSDDDVTSDITLTAVWDESELTVDGEVTATFSTTGVYSTSYTPGTSGIEPFIPRETGADVTLTSQAGASLDFNLDPTTDAPLENVQTDFADIRGGSGLDDGGTTVNSNLTATPNTAQYIRYEFLRTEGGGTIELLDVSLANGDSPTPGGGTFADGYVLWWVSEEVTISGDAYFDDGDGNVGRSESWDVTLQPGWNWIRFQVRLKSDGFSFDSDYNATFSSPPSGSWTWVQ